MPGQVRDMIEGILREFAGPRRSCATSTPTCAKLVVEVDTTGTVGRVNADIPYTVVVGMHQLACIHRVQI
jgi:hypothetical protein